MAPISLFWNTCMAAVTSWRLVCFLSLVFINTNNLQQYTAGTYKNFWTYNSLQVIFLQLVINWLTLTKEAMTLIVLGYMILIRIDLYNFIFFRFLFSLSVHWEIIKHSRQGLTTFPSTPTFAKNAVLCNMFSTLFSLFETKVKTRYFVFNILQE